MKSKSIISIMLIVAVLSSCVQKTHQKTIHFKLDMTTVENPKDVGVRGEFGANPWDDTIYLTDEDGDHIFEGTVTKQTGQGGIEFKFVNHHDAFELQDQNNRYIPFEYRPQTMVYEAIFNTKEGKLTVTNAEKE